jgi:putative transposase
MRKSRFSDQQIAFILRQAEEGTSVAEVCRKAGVSEATYYIWRKKYGGLMPSQVKRLKQLEEENAKLKRIVADLALDKEMLQDVIKRKLGGLRGGASWSIG